MALAIDDGLKKLEYLSLVSKICTELESHVGCGDKVLAEFITELGCRSETVEEFDTKLKENGAEMPDYFVRTLLTIIHAIVPPKPKSAKPSSSDQNQGKEKSSAFPALSRPLSLSLSLAFGFLNPRGFDRSGRVLATMEGGRTEEVGSSSASRTLRDVLATPPGSGNDALVDERNAELDEEEVEGEEDEEVGADGFVPGPLIPLKEQLEKDKDDESLRRWKEKLLGCLEGELNGQMEPEVTFHSIGIVSEGCAETITPLPVAENQSCVLFILKEGSQYRLKLTFSVKHNIVSGLTYLNTVWKKGLQVDQRKGMLGTFAPQRGPYEHLLEEETTPSGSLARGIYSAKLKFEDDDKRCHLELDYSFEIKKR